MAVLMYTSEEDADLVALGEEIAGWVGGEQLEWLHSMEGLGERLRQPSEHVEVAFLAPRNREELAQLVSMRACFTDVRLVMVAPDSEAESVSMAHRLWPRFVAPRDEGLREVRAVLMRMIEKSLTSAL